MVAAGSACSLTPSPGSLASEDLAFLVSWRPGAVVQGLWDTVSAPAVLLYCKLSPSQFTSHWVFLRKAVALPCSLGWTLGGFQWNSCRVQMQAAFSDFSPPPLALDSWCGDLRATAGLPSPVCGIPRMLACRVPTLLGSCVVTSIILTTTLK